MSHPLGHHVIRWTPESKAAVQRSPGGILKLVGTESVDAAMVAAYKRARPGGLVVYRPVWTYEDLSDPAGYARQTLAEAAPIAGWVDYHEGYNEICQTRKNGALARYAAWSVEYGMEMRRHGARYACGSFSTGNPDFLILPDYYPALRAADAISVHEYWWSGWSHALRYRELLAVLPRDCRKPVIVTECGADDGQRHGWRTLYGGDAGAFAADLRAYGAELARNGVRAAVFSLGTREDFGDFGYDTDAAVLDAIDQEVAGDTPTERPHDGGTTMAYNVGPGMLAKMAELGDKPASDEQWLTANYSEAMGESGRLYRYIKAINATVVFTPGQA